MTNRQSLFSGVFEKLQLSAMLWAGPRRRFCLQFLNSIVKSAPDRVPKQCFQLPTVSALIPDYD